MSRDECAAARERIRDLRYATAELRTRGEVGLADIVEQATNELVKRGVPVGTPAGPDSESGSCPATGEGVSVEPRVLPGANPSAAMPESRSAAHTKGGAMLYAIRRGLETNEAQWLWKLGPWDVGAGVFKGFGLGFTVQPGEWDVTLGPFSIGGVRE